MATIGVPSHTARRRFSLSETIVTGFVALLDAVIILVTGLILLSVYVDRVFIQTPSAFIVLGLFAALMTGLARSIHALVRPTLDETTQV